MSSNRKKRRRCKESARCFWQMNVQAKKIKWYLPECVCYSSPLLQYQMEKIRQHYQRIKSTDNGEGGSDDADRTLPAKFNAHIMRAYCFL
jgi:hypothetical protein